MLKSLDYETFYQLMIDYDQLNFLKTKEYAQAREQMGWLTKILGYYEDDQLVGACMLHAKKLPKLNSYLYYVPRGLVIDYTKEHYVIGFTNELKAYIKAHRGYCLRIDPELTSDIDGKENPIVNTLRSCGYRHLGYVNNFEGTQPRCTIINNLANKTYEEVYQGYEKRCQKHIKNALNNGIKITTGTLDDLDEFMEIMNDTALRGGYITRSREYFEILLNSFGKHMQMYFAEFQPQLVDINQLKMDIEDYDEHINHLLKEQNDVNSSKKRAKKIASEITQLRQSRDKLIKNLNLITDIITNYPKGIKLSTALYVMYEDQAWYWFGGSRTIYRELNPVYAMFDHYLHYLCDHDFSSFDLLGISGNLDDPNDKNYGLYQFKKSFGGEVVKFVGEFDLVINKSLYHIANKLLTIAQSSQKNPLLDRILKVVNNN